MGNADKSPSSVGPLSYSEQARWDEFTTDSAKFFSRHADIAFDLPREVGGAAADELVAAICDRHAIFRTVFETMAGQPSRNVLADYRHVIATADEPDDPPSGHQSGGLAPADLVSFRLAPGPDGGQTLAIRLNEMITDTWSCAHLRSELTRLRDAPAVGRGTVLEPLTVTYAEFAREQRERPISANLAAYWRRELEGIGEVSSCPAQDGPDPGGDQAAERILMLSDDATQALRGLCRSHRASPFMVVTALVNMAIAAVSKVRDVPLITMATSRTNKWADVHGNFSNPTLLRTRLPAEPTFADTLARSRDTVLKALEQPVPYLQLAELTDQQLPASPLRLHYLPSRAHHYAEILASKPSGLAWSEETDFAGWPLDLGFIEDSRKRVAIWASYDPRIFTHATVDTLIDACRRLLERVTTDGDVAVSDLERDLSSPV